MRKAVALLSAVLLCSTAWATEPPLPPGKPAGVKPAISHSTEVYILVGTAAAAVLAGIALFNMNKASTPATSTSP
jgi:hypothetical protein